MRTNVEVLRDLDKLPESMRDDVIAGIVAQLEELTSLVADVVELARGDEPVVHLEDVSYERIVEHAVARARRHWPELRFILGSSPVMVRAVPARLDRAVNNLLDNAGKFSPPRGQVDVALFPDGRLTVRDHGPGVPEESLPHVARPGDRRAGRRVARRTRGAAQRTRWRRGGRAVAAAAAASRSRSDACLRLPWAAGAQRCPPVLRG
jgi:two-component system sensor histidine kinase MprB